MAEFTVEDFKRVHRDRMGDAGMYRPGDEKIILAALSLAAKASAGPVTKSLRPMRSMTRRPRRASARSVAGVTLPPKNSRHA